MDPKVKKEWITVLRSGDYEQGRGALIKDGKYCCLGVLADVLGELPADNYDTDDVLTPRMAQLAGLESCDPHLKYANYNTRCSMLNDSLKLTFDQIADLIEEQL